MKHHYLKFAFSIALLTSFSLFAAESTLTISDNKLQFVIASDLPKGTYKIWDLTRNQIVGSNISKDANEEAFGKITVSADQANNKFVILDSNSEVVSALQGKSTTEKIDSKLDPMGIGQKMKTASSSSSRSVLKSIKATNAANSQANTASGSGVVAGTDQLEYLNQLIAAQKGQLSSVEEKSRSNKVRIQKLLKNKKSLDCKKELETAKSSPDAGTLCKSIKELATAYQKAEDQLKTSTKIKVQTLEATGASSGVIASANQAIALNSTLPTNLDPKSLEVPATTIASTTTAPTGSWGLAQRFYDVVEYSVCLCGTAIAQVPGKSCPANSIETGHYTDGPYYLNNGATTCDLNSNPPNAKFVQDNYTPPTFTADPMPIHGKAVLAQAEALIASGEYKKLSGPQAFEFMNELGQINYQSFKEGEPINRAIDAFRDVASAYLKELEVKQAANREAKKNVVVKPWGDVTIKLLNMELEENRAAIDSTAVVAITAPVSVKDGIGIVRLVGGFWGQHGYEVSVDKKNFYPIETPVEVNNGDVIYLRGKTVKAYNHAIGIETLFAGKTVNGYPSGMRENIFVKTEKGCNNDGFMQMDFNYNLAPTTFPKGMRAGCFAQEGIYGEREKGTEIWQFGQGIGVQVPLTPRGGSVTVNCSEVHVLAGRVTPYKIGPYKNPYSGETQDYYPVRECKVKGTLRYVCNQKDGGWELDKSASSCELE